MLASCGCPNVSVLVGWIGSVLSSFNPPDRSVLTHSVSFVVAVVVDHNGGGAMFVLASVATVGTSQWLAHEDSLLAKLSVAEGVEPQLFGIGCWTRRLHSFWLRLQGL